MGTFQTVAKTSALPAGAQACVSAGGKRIALFNVDGAYYAIEDNCNHRGGPLSEGEIHGKIVTCPWHGAQFDVSTGEPKRPPAQMPLLTFPVKVQGEDIQVEV
jgi:3-phenylpropionate/trans-cinnamate dioxygenase ferredoxin component